MNRAQFLTKVQSVLAGPMEFDGNFALNANFSQQANQQHTNEAFSEKWQKYGESGEEKRLYKYQLDWYLQLYGFETEDALRDYLRSCDVILDAGCGLGYKAEWFARLAPDALVIGMDYSDAARQAAVAYADLPNLFFIQGDIATTGFREGSVAYASCDQVIMHTESPELTFAELARVTKRPQGEVACYFYAKKALPRELLDDHFRIACKDLTHEELWAMSEQLTELGWRLSDLNVSFDAPEIPALGIKAGRIDIQRFIYWNFLKCFWNAELGHQTSVVTNFDWYSPSNARRFSEEEVRSLVTREGLRETFFHKEEACYSGRFAHV